MNKLTPLMPEPQNYIRDFCGNFEIAVVSLSAIVIMQTQKGDMKLLKRTRLHARGSGRLKLLLITPVFIVAALGSSLFLNPHIAHANGYQYMGSSLGIQFYACTDFLSSAQGIVIGLAIAPPGVDEKSSDVFLEHYSNNGTWQPDSVSTGTWYNGGQSQYAVLQYLANVSPDNFDYIRFETGKLSSDTPYARPRDLPPC